MHADADDPLKALTGPAAPPAALREEVKRSLGERGLLAPRHAPRAMLGRSLAYAAAAALFFAAGALVGQRGASAPRTAASGQRYALFLYEDSTFRTDVPEASLVAEYSAWADSLRRRGALVAGEKLRDAEGTVLVGDAREAASAGLSGFFIVRAAGEDEALALARSCPHLRYGGRIVLREIQPT